MSCLALAAFGKILSYHSTLASLRLREAQKKEKEERMSFLRTPREAGKPNASGKKYNKKEKKEVLHTRFLRRCSDTKLSSRMDVLNEATRSDVQDNAPVKKERFPRGFMCVCVCVNDRPSLCLTVSG